MKKCPFCAEEIQDEALKCKHCLSPLDEKPKLKWFFRPAILVVFFLCIGPLALPLVWFHPRLSIKVKVVITVIVAVASYYLGIATIKSVSSIKQYYQGIF